MFIGKMPKIKYSSKIAQLILQICVFIIAKLVCIFLLFGSKITVILAV